MKLQYFLVGMILASSFIIGTSYMLGDFIRGSGIPVNTTYASVYNQTIALNQVANETNGQFKTNTIQTTTLNPLQITSFPIIQLVINSYSITYSMITQATNDMGLPPWINAAILTIVSLVLLFAVLAAVFFGRTV